jgi:hypothetical protein
VIFTDVLNLNQQDLREEREQERTKSPNKKKSSAASSLLCAKKSNKRKRFNSPLKRGQPSQALCTAYCLW